MYGKTDSDAQKCTFSHSSQSSLRVGKLAFVNPIVVHVNLLAKCVHGCLIVLQADSTFHITSLLLPITKTATSGGTGNIHFHLTRALAIAKGTVEELW